MSQQLEPSQSSAVPDRPRHAAYPFTAIVGQEEMRLALLLNAVDPRIGGVLIRGEKGTAKSTMARALAELLPELRVVKGCAYSCDPDDQAGRCELHGDEVPVEVAVRPMRIVELPANATEDRLAGTLDIKAVLERGEARFEPGLLAQANRGILYVDEVNLLPDHLVDLLLDAAAMGRNRVEREGVSLSHPARFILIGTMNPEEGDLRPQLLDRFGLCVDVVGIRTIDGRVEVMRRRAAWENEPAAFVAAWRGEQATLAERLERARGLLPAVTAADEILRLIAGIAVELGVEGHRADIVMQRAAAAIAALDACTEVSPKHVRRAAALALAHRMRRRPFDQQQFSDERLQEAMDSLQDQSEPAGGQVEDGDLIPGVEPEERSDEAPPPVCAPEGRTPPRPDAQSSDVPSPPPPTAPRPAEAGRPLAMPALEIGRDRSARAGSGRRQRTLSLDQRGRYVRATLPVGPPVDVALGATVRAAAMRTSTAVWKLGAGPAVDAGARAAVAVRLEDVRVKVRERRVGTNIIFVADASGSMGAKRRMEAVKGAAVTLLTEAYQRRDRVALIAFRGKSAETLLPLTDSVELVHRRLIELPVGGRTPLAAGLRTALDLIRQLRLKDPRAICVPVLITDGRANAGSGAGSPVEEALALAPGLRQPGVHPLVLDSEDDFLNFGLARRLAERAGAQYVRLAELSAGAIAGSIRQVADGILPA
jgi:magnesium chelatase subunit D